MLYKTDILAIVGGGKNPKFSPIKVILWDDNEGKIINEFRVKSNIINVKIKKDKIFIICEEEINVYNLDNYNLLEIIETCNNSKGVFGINSNVSNSIISYPINPIGYIRIKNYEKSKINTICSFDEIISYISINSQGNLIAVSSIQGKLIRIFLINNGDFIEEFKRGKEKADINYITFDLLCNYIAVSSNRKTIHIWSLKNTRKIIKDKNIDFGENEKKLPENNNYRLFIDYFGLFNNDNIKSFAQIRLNDEKTIVSFGPENILICISYNGKYYQTKFDENKGGECEIIHEESLYKR